MSANGRWGLYQRLGSIVLGFHGCDEEVGESILHKAASHLRESQNDYDWLGHGIYFWENSPQHALEFSREAAAKPHLTRGKVKRPFVIGAIIDLGFCLNMTDAAALQEVEDAHSLLTCSFEDKSAMPENQADRRILDCAVIETLHTYRRVNQLAPYDTVRGMFIEGSPLYPGAGFNKKDHVQLCVRDKTSIKGYFRPLPMK
jgi:hypothetical protein